MSKAQPPLLVVHLQLGLIIQLVLKSYLFMNHTHRPELQIRNLDDDPDPASTFIPG